MRRRIQTWGAALATLAVATVIGVGANAGGKTASAVAATTTTAAQQINMKVLLITSSTDSTTGDGAAFVDWENTLNAEGVPYDTVVTSSQALPPLSSTAADGTQVANYEGVIVAGSGTDGLTAAQWTTLQTYEQEFSVRQLTADAVSSADYGLQTPANGGDSLLCAPGSTVAGCTGASAPGATSLSLTTDGKSVFPYLTSIALDPSYPTYGSATAPLASPGGTVDTLISDQAGDSLLGVFTTPDGRQTMYQTFNMGPGYLQSELLRHGELAWLTRGTYFGYTRNYLETDIDDNFLSDDVWSTTTHNTDYTPADALREVPADVTTAANWSAANKFRIDMLFNGGGSTEYSEDTGTTDPLIAAFKSDAGDFGWINHTWDHPNLDGGCANATYIDSEITQNTNWATTALGLKSGTTALGTQNPGVVVTGEHSGLANLIPGNPGTVDPPEFDSITPVAGTSALPAGAYTYAITDDFTPGGGQSSASEETTTAVPAGDTFSIKFDAVCHAADYYIYRENPESTTWTLVASTPAQPNQFGDNGPITYTVPDPGTSTTSANTPSTTANAAVEGTYPQNPDLDGAFKTAGITDFGSDASKPYPTPAADQFQVGTVLADIPQVSKGSTFFQATSGAQAIPRYPTNIYYNVSTQAEEVDEFNHLYDTPTADVPGVCVTGDCHSTAWTWDQILQSVVGDGGGFVGMFQHLVANDPRPDYFHQTNLMSVPATNTAGYTSAQEGDGLYYSVMDSLLGYYDSFFDMSSDAGSTPITQPTMAEIGQILNDQNAWAGVAGTTVTGSIEGSTVTVANSGTAAVDVPLTGTTDGMQYEGTKSEMTSVPAGSTKSYTATSAWPAPPSTTVTVTVPTGPAPTVGSGTKPAPGPGATTTTSPPSTETTTTTTTPAPVAKTVKKTVRYHAVQAAPKKVTIHKGKVMVSLKCVASSGKTAKGHVCKGTFVLAVGKAKVKHSFRLTSGKVKRIAVKLPQAARAAASRGKGEKVTGKLTITTSVSGAKKGIVSRGKLTVRR